MKLDPIIGSTLSVAITSATRGEVIEVFDSAEWQNALATVTTVGFTEHPAGTLITNQYADLGLLFTDGNDNIVCCGNAFRIDGAGVGGGFPFGPITLAFVTPQSGIAAEFPGAVRFSLFSRGALLYESQPYSRGLGNLFVGLVSTAPFDAVVIDDPIDNAVFLDDLYFGVPAPGVLPLVALAGAMGGRRRGP
jgi:hypothetical protein